MIVKRITESPMNVKRWVLDLECGHEVWITSERRPKMVTFTCPTCKK